MNPNQQSILGTAGSIISGIGDTFNSIGDFFELMTDPHTYLRIFMVVFGFLLIIGALTYGQ